MKTLSKLIKERKYAEAKSIILENRDQIEEIADTLLMIIDDMAGAKIREIEYGQIDRLPDIGCASRTWRFLEDGEKGENLCSFEPDKSSADLYSVDQSSGSDEITDKDVQDFTDVLNKHYGTPKEQHSKRLYDTVSAQLPGKIHSISSTVRLSDGYNNRDPHTMKANNTDGYVFEKSESSADKYEDCWYDTIHKGMIELISELPSVVRCTVYEDGTGRTFETTVHAIDDSEVVKIAGIIHYKRAAGVCARGGVAVEFADYIGELCQERFNLVIVNSI